VTPFSSREQVFEFPMSDTIRLPVVFRRLADSSGNFVQLDWRAHTRNMIHIWLPEGVHTDNPAITGVVHPKRGSLYQYKRIATDHWAHTFENRARCDCVASAVHRDGIEMSLELTNLTPQIGRTCGRVCVQLIAAPDFATTIGAHFSVLTESCTVSRNPPSARHHEFYRRPSSPQTTLSRCSRQTPGLMSLPTMGGKGPRRSLWAGKKKKICQVSIRLVYSLFTNISPHPSAPFGPGAGGAAPQ